jgi:type II secretory ATPase GspE/PulE/Tfp pilus assembly ATPase PilB-like protein
MDIRFRGSDGCVVMPPISQKHAGRVLQDAKAFSGLSTRESRGYRGGSAEMTMPDGNVINLRVEAQRAFSGEAITLRLLDKRVVTSLSRTLPFPPAYAGVMRDILNQKSGIVIVCGPTGSGKTTTLWRCLLSLDSSEMRIMTIEDPVEYRFDRVVQLPVRGKEESDIQESEHPETFISALRSCLRANPDVVLVGEMRDSETAATAVQASLTGHLILSTLHTPDSTGAIPRLMNMGVDALNIRQTLSAVVYQRLAPRLCPKCRIAEKPTPEQLAHYEFYGLPAPDFLFRRCGCPDCRNLGFDGKEAVFEILIITPELRRHIKADFDDGAFRALWIDQGGRTLAATALELAAKGILSYKLVKELDGAWIIHSGAKEIGSLRQKG